MALIPTTCNGTHQIFNQHVSVFNPKIRPVIIFQKVLHKIKINRETVVKDGLIKYTTVLFSGKHSGKGTHCNSDVFVL